MYGSLIPEKGGDAIPLLKTTVTVGRHPFSDILLDFANVSIRHCELQFVDGIWYVVDLRSTNGVRVNDVRVDDRAPLAPGDSLTVARKYHYRIEYEGSEEAKKLAEKSDKKEDGVFGKSLLEKAGLMRTPRKK